MSSLAVYRAATGLARIPVRLYLGLRARRGKEDIAHLPERRGIASIARPQGPLVWMHAASVGESQSVLSLVDRLLEMQSGLRVLVTSGTVTSADLLRQRLPDRAIHQYVPADLIGWVRSFLAHWRPNLALFVESELWPNMIVETAARGCPLVLVNGRMSDRSFARWRKAPGMARALLGRFALCLGQTERDRERFAALGAPRCDYLGNLKYSAEPLPCDEAALAALREAVSGRPLWLAASTHAGEEKLAAEVHMHLREAKAGLLTIVVPRHPDRGDEIESLLRTLGLGVSRRSRGEMPAPGDDIYLADTMGELGLFYRLAGIAFIGGSTLGLGGHNPVEAERLDCAILHGPDMANFRNVAADLKSANAAIAVAGVDSLAGELDNLLVDDAARARLADNAARVAAENRGALDRVADALGPFVAAASDEAGG